MGTAVSSPGTSTRAGQGGSANPAVVTKCVQPPSALVSDPLGPQQHQQIQEPFREAYTHRYTHSTSNVAGKKEGEMEKTLAPRWEGQQGPTRMGYPEAALSCHPGCLWIKAKAKCCIRSSEHPHCPIPTLWAPKKKPRNAQAFASLAVPKAPPSSPANPIVILSSCSVGFKRI